MEWDLAVCPRPMASTLAFNQLLDTLRRMHEEVCGRLESYAKSDQLGLLAGKEQWPVLAAGPMPPRPWAPASTSEAKQEGIAKVVPAAPRGPRTPRNVDASSKDIQDLRRCIDNLSKHQACLSHQIAQLVSTGIRPAQDHPVNDRAVSAVISTIQADGVSNNIADSPQPAVRNSSCGNDLEKDAPSEASHQNEDPAEEHRNAESRFKVEIDGNKDLDTSTSRRWSEVEKKKLIKWGDWRNMIRSALDGPTFTMITSLLILSYSALIAVETNMIAENPETDSAIIKQFHYVFTGIFCFELVIRWAAYGCSFLTGTDAFWNRLDVFFVISAITEMILENAVVSTARAVVRGVRLGRVMRTVRLVRTFSHFHEFQKMSFALLSSMKTLGCSLALLMFVMFFFAVWLTQSAADKEARKIIPDLELRYGNLMSTVYTLYLSVSNGISWDYCYMPLHEMNWIAAQAFILYLSMTLFGVLNVVTSIFVESVIRSVQHSRDLIVQEKEEEKKIAIVHMREVFRQLDIDNSGQISMEEVEHFLEEPNLRKYVEALDIEAPDTRMLFKMLDSDSSGVISSDEFCDGCLRLKGHARSIDVHALIYQVKAFLDKWGEFTGYVDESFSHIRRRLPRDQSHHQSQHRSSSHSRHSHNDGTHGHPPSGHSDKLPIPSDKATLREC